MLSAWPECDKKWIDKKIEAEFELVIGEIQAIRNVRSAWQINPKESVAVAIKASREKELQILKDHSTTVVQMAKVSSLQIGKNVTRPRESAVANIGRVETYVVLSGLIDIQVERQRIETALADVDRTLRGLETRLQNNEFLKKAPQDIVDKEKRRAEELENRKKRLEENLRTLL
jgi:valyl-tRNA synthetase